MEWVETTAKTIDAARAVALDQLGVAADEAEIEIIEEPKAGLFGRVRGEARLRARVRPTPVRAKQDRRRRSRGGSGGEDKRSSQSTDSVQGPSERDEAASPDGDEPGDGGAAPATAGERKGGDGGRPNGRNGSGSRRDKQPKKQEQKMTDQNSAAEDPSDETARDQADADANTAGRDGSSDDVDERAVSPDEVGAAAVAFMDGLTDAFGVNGTSALTIEGTEIELAVSGDELGLLVGSGGRTLNAIQDLVRVAAQRRLGDHDTRLRIDVAGYRERRQTALAEFARRVAEEVRSSGSARSMEPMTSADRKVIHDVLNEETGVDSRSEGEDPNRRIIVVPAD